MELSIAPLRHGAGENFGQNGKAVVSAGDPGGPEGRAATPGSGCRHRSRRSGFRGRHTATPNPGEWESISCTGIKTAHAFRSRPARGAVGPGGFGLAGSGRESRAKRLRAVTGRHLGRVDSPPPSDQPTQGPARRHEHADQLLGEVPAAPRDIAGGVARLHQVRLAGAVRSPTKTSIPAAELQVQVGERGEIPEPESRQSHCDEIVVAAAAARKEKSGGQR